jgi:hypothetical protein
MRYIPINGNELYEKGVTQAIGPRGSLTLTRDMLASPTTPFVPTTIIVDSISATASVMANLGFSGVTVTTQSDVTYFVLDLIAAGSVASSNPGFSGLWVNGVGLRVGFSGVSVSGNAAISVGGLAAAGTLQAKATLLQGKLIGVGLNTSSLGFVQSLVSAAATLNTDSLQSLGSAFSQFIDYLSNTTSLTPMPVGIVMEPGGAQEESIGTSYCYALRAIHDNMSLTTALGKGVNTLPDGVQRLDPVLWATYFSILGSTDPTVNPTDSEMQLAKDLLTCGP